MKILSGLIVGLLLALAVSFALSNRQAASVSLWPFDLVIEAPLYLLTLGTLAAGLVAGSLATWLGCLRHRFAARRLRGDIAVQHGKVDELQKTAARHAAMAETPLPFTTLGLDPLPWHRRMWNRYRDNRP